MNSVVKHLHVRRLKTLNILSLRIFVTKINWSIVLREIITTYRVTENG